MVLRDARLSAIIENRPIAGTVIVQIEIELEPRFMETL
jgi:hypothetical protein